MKSKSLHRIYRTAVPLVTLLFALTPTFAAAPRIAYERTWGGVGPDVARGVAVAPDGSTYVGGYTGSFGTGAADGDWDVLLLKYDAAGTLVWQRTWGNEETPGSRQGRDDDYALDLALGPDGSIHLGGVYFAGGGALALKFDPNGNLIWSRTWQHPNQGHAQSVAVGPDGSVYLAGGINGVGAGSDDMLIIKLDSGGSLVWQQTWGGPINELARDVAVASDGSVYVGGEANSFFFTDAVLLKYAPNGTLIWQRDWHEGGSQDLTYGEGVAIAPNGTIYLAGISLVNTVGQHVFVANFGPDGGLLSDKIWNENFDTASSVAVGADGNVYVTGATLSGNCCLDAFVVQFQAGGRVRAITWGGAGEETAYGIAVGPTGAVHIAGTAQAPPYRLRNASNKSMTPSSFVAAPSGTVTDPAGTMAVATGSLLVPNGSQTYAGDVDAALVKIIF